MKYIKRRSRNKHLYFAVDKDNKICYVSLFEHEVDEFIARKQ